MTLHQLLDSHYGEDGLDVLKKMLESVDDINAVNGYTLETPLHTATRRRRLEAIKVLLDFGADIDAKTRGGKTAFAHASRRSFDEVAAFLKIRGCDTALNKADEFAIAVGSGKLDDAAKILEANPNVIRTGNPEEDRVLADVAGRNDSEPVTFLIEAGAQLAVPGLDSGTPLHIAAWFGQSENTRLLLEAGAPLDIFDMVHASSPLGWAVHGARYSGGAEERQQLYVEIIKMLLAAGSSCHYPGDPSGDQYWKRLIADATPSINAVLQEFKDPRLD